MDVVKPWRQVSDEVQLEEVQNALLETQGHITKAAVLLGCHRSHVSRLLKKWKLDIFARELRLARGEGRGRPAAQGEDLRDEK